MSQAEATQTPASVAQVVAAWQQQRDQLIGWLSARLSDPSLAEDMAQQAIANALGALQRGRSIARPTAWLKTAAKHALADHYRAAARRPVAALPDELTDTEQAVNMEAHQRLTRCLEPFAKRLSPTYQRAFSAVDLQGLSLQQFADNEGIGLSAAKSRVRRARQQMHQKYLECCEFDIEDGLITNYRARSAS